MAAHGKADKRSKRQESNRRDAKLKVVKVAVVGKGARERLVEIGVAEQVIVATSSKEGIVSALKTALKLSEDVVCYDFESYGLVRDDSAKGTAYSAAPTRQTPTTPRRSAVAQSSDEEPTTDSSESESDSDSEDEDEFRRSTIPLTDVADALRSWTDHAVRSYIHCCFLFWNRST
jgi:hypothetical protein